MHNIVRQKNCWDKLRYKMYKTKDEKKIFYVHLYRK